MIKGLTGKFLSIFGLSDSARTEIRREIDFFQAVEAHVTWKRRLANYLDGAATETLVPDVVCQDNQCALGKWIHGAGRARLGEYPAFQTLITEHALFHLHAAKVIEAHQAGDDARAQQLLTNDFARQSKKTVDCITQLHMELDGTA